MYQQDVSADALEWRRRAAALAAKLNFHHWLSRLVPKFFVVMIVAAFGELLRREMNGQPLYVVALILLGTTLVVAWAWMEARRHFCSRTQALVRLETILRLHNRLSCAESGIVPWPRAINDDHTPDGYELNWKQIVVPLFAGILFLYAAHLVPVHQLKAGSVSGTISEPPDFAQIQNWINQLKAADVIEPEKLAETQASLDKLRQRAPQDWYTQNSLEAADSLKQVMEQSMNTMESNLDQADEALDAMQEQEKQGTAANSASLRPIQDKLSQAGDGLASGNFPMKKELTDALKGAASSDKQLSASQMAQLQKQLQQGKGACQGAGNGNKGGGFSDEMQQAMAGADAHGLAKRRMVPGSGGPGGGGPPAPLVLQERDKFTPEGAKQPVKNDDMSHVALGDTIKITAGTPNVDPNAYQGNTSAGGAHVTGNGGEAVWRSTYDPQEADILSRFFQ